MKSSSVRLRAVVHWVSFTSSSRLRSTFTTTVMQDEDSGPCYLIQNLHRSSRSHRKVSLRRVYECSHSHEPGRTLMNSCGWRHPSLEWRWGQLCLTWIWSRKKNTRAREALALLERKFQLGTSGPRKASPPSSQCKGVTWSQLLSHTHTQTPKFKRASTNSWTSLC